MNTVRLILKAKGNQVWSIPKDARVSEAIALFVEKKIGSVIVMDGKTVVGIFTERDFAHKVGFYGTAPSLVKIEDVMTKDLVTVKPDNTVNDCMAIMTDRHIRHLPVYDDGQLVGLLSIGDVVKDMIDELNFMVTQLENYIKGLR